MKKFMYVYYGGGKPENMSMDEVMADWGKWFQELGDKLVDGGGPFNDDGHTVTSSKVEKISADNWPATGYSIVNAESMEEATEMAKGCPSHRHNPDSTSVRVYEVLAM